MIKNRSVPWKRRPRRWEILSLSSNKGRLVQVPRFFPTRSFEPSLWSWNESKGVDHLDAKRMQGRLKRILSHPISNMHQRFFQSYLSISCCRRVIFDRAQAFNFLRKIEYLRFSTPQNCPKKKNVVRDTKTRDTKRVLDRHSCLGQVLSGFWHQILGLRIVSALILYALSTMKI